MTCCFWLLRFGYALQETGGGGGRRLLLRLFESYETVCRQKDISLKLHMPDDILPPVLSDPAYLYQLLSILLENAITYGIPPSGEKPVIELSAHQSGRHITLSVTDHGPGIPDEKKEAVFRRFTGGTPPEAKRNISDWACPLPVNWPAS